METYPDFEDFWQKVILPNLKDKKLDLKKLKNKCWQAWQNGENALGKPEFKW